MRVVDGRCGSMRVVDGRCESTTVDDVAVARERAAGNRPLF
jgi:hypothetical protein